MNKRIGNAALSDLFFSHDRVQAEVYDPTGEFSHYDEEEMVIVATEFCRLLQGIGCLIVPNPRDLVEDFFARL